MEQPGRAGRCEQHLHATRARGLAGDCDVARIPAEARYVAPDPFQGVDLIERGIIGLEAEDIADWIGRRWSAGYSPLASAPEYESYVLDQWDNDRFTPFWRRLGIYARGWYDRFADVPTVHMSSWYDPYSQTAIDNFTGLAPIKRGPVKLLLGPWTHGRRSRACAGDVDFGVQAPLDGNVAPGYFTLRRDWFDRHLRGLDAPEHLPAPVRLFVMGGGSGRRTSAGRLDHGGVGGTKRRGRRPIVCRRRTSCTRMEGCSPIHRSQTSHH